MTKDNLALWGKGLTLVLVIVGGVWLYRIKPPPAGFSLGAPSSVSSGTPVAGAVAEDVVLLPAGVTIPVRWGDLGARLVAAGVIDAAKFEALYEARGGLSPEEKELLVGQNNGEIKITPANAGLWLNLLWAFGLANKNPVLETGPMTDSQYGGAGNFASTGGWTLSRGKAMNHYSQHRLVELTPDQQALVERVAKGIYRPCCGNSTYFPDCNHGMAMLGLLELMAASGISEPEMYRLALQVNAYWFPDTYLTIAQYLRQQGRDWATADPRELLGYDYSSGAGYQKILRQATPPASRGGAACGV